LEACDWWVCKLDHHQHHDHFYNDNNYFDNNYDYDYDNGCAVCLYHMPSEMRCCHNDFSPWWYNFLAPWAKYGVRLPSDRNGLQCSLQLFRSRRSLLSAGW
jgi:hypothetical protein